MIPDLNKTKEMVFLLILLICSCGLNKSQTESSKEQIIQKCLNFLSVDERKYKTITVIINEVANENMHLMWRNKPVEFEKNNLKDISALLRSGKLYFMIVNVACGKDKTEISIVCINANLGYRFELRKTAEGKESLKIIQEIDDALPFRQNAAFQNHTSFSW